MLTYARVSTDNRSTAVTDITTAITDNNITAVSSDIWSDNHVCDFLDNVTDSRVTVTCGIDRFLPPFLFVIGLVSNVLVVLVMRSKSFRSLSTSFYMIVNAVADSSSILVALPIHYIFVNIPHAFAEIRDFHALCSFFNVFGWGTSDLGILYTVAMTTERAIAVKYPLKAYKLCTTRRAKFVVAGLTIFELVKVSHLIFKSRIVSDTHSRLCDVDLKDAVYVTFYEEVWPWLHFSILIVSYFIVMAGNVIIFINIHRSNYRDTSAGRKSLRKSFHSGNKNKQISVMLMIDSFTLVVCTFPFAIISIIASQSVEIFDLPGGKNLAYTVTFYLLYLNRCLNLFLYCVSGSRFRDALKVIFLTKSRGLALERSVSRHERSMSVSRRPEEMNAGATHELKYNNNNTDFLESNMAAEGVIQKGERQITSPSIFLTAVTVQAETETRDMPAEIWRKPCSDFDIVSTHL